MEHFARRAVWWAGLTLCLALALPAAARKVRNLDLAVDTPVYRVPANRPLLDGRQRYALRWAGIPVGRVEVAMRPRNDAPGLRFEIRGATHPAIDWVFRYRFSGRGNVHTAPFAPDHFVVHECTNRRHDRTEVRFAGGGAPVRGIRSRPGKVREYVFHSENTYDLPSATYLLLNLDYAPGAHYELDTFTGKSRYLLRADVLGRESITAAGARHEAWRLRLRTRELTDDDPEGRHGETTVWVSRGLPRRLLRAHSETFVGAITLELEAGSGRGGAAIAPARVRGRCS